MNKGKKLYEGKAKILYEGPEKGTAIQHFKDDATAYNNQKKSIVEGKGVLNNRISEHILNNLNQIGVKTHLIKRLNMREQLVRLVEIIPLEFIVRNIATGSLTKRLGIPDGTVLSKPLIEYSYKNDELGDPLIAREHILEFKWASQEILLADEISPDTCRLWDVISEKKLDKDRFRKDLGNIIQAYQEVARRLGIIHEEANISEVKLGKPKVVNIKNK